MGYSARIFSYFNFFVSMLVRVFYDLRLFFMYFAFIVLTFTALVYTVMYYYPDPNSYKPVEWKYNPDNTTYPNAEDSSPYDNKNYTAPPRPYLGNL